MPEFYKVRYKRIMVEEVEIYAYSPEDAMYRVDDGKFSSVDAHIHTKYPMFESILAEDGNGIIYRKKGGN